MTPQINGTLQSLKQEASELSIDDLRKVSVKKVQDAVSEKIHEAKGNIKGSIVEKIEETKAKLLDAAVQKV